GGIDLGLRAVLPDCRTITYVEIEAFACANLVAKMEQGELDSAPIWTNLHTFDARPYRGHVGILSSGFPCQPFSQAGSRRSDEDPRHLFPQIERIIDECRPGCVFFENVEGIITARLRGAPETSVLRHVMERLEARGYATTWGMFSAAECGAPHRRNRVFILALADRDSCGQQGNKECNSQPEEWRPQLRHNADRRDHDMADADCTSLEGGGIPSRVHKEHNIPHSDGAANRELANTYDSRGGKDKQPPEQGSDRLVESPVDTRRMHSGTAQQVTRWPAGPGQEQHDWEEPRTTQPGMGGATDGPSTRVDRLRLLGNGVVPQVAACAFTQLFSELIEREETS
ncbi:MAG: DNA cytosine methyltransferase, partial [Actinomycetota bacterium]|nr:DNA cytosine methyltransferase [Actinomycetota bacterium]